MKIFKTIDLWTEYQNNHQECFNGAFIDGFEHNNQPFDEYKIIINCNCIIETNEFGVKNKHNTIIFYKEDIPVRLLVINKNTNLEKCIDTALEQTLDKKTLKEIFKNKKIKSSIIDLKEEHINNQYNTSKIDISSCDRWNLLYSMLKGNNTENQIDSKQETDKYEFIPDLYIKYKLITDKEIFEIEHKCGFINDSKTRIIAIQENSKLTGGING